MEPLLLLYKAIELMAENHQIFLLDYIDFSKTIKYSVADFSTTYTPNKTRH